MKILIFPTSLLIRSNKDFLFHLIYFILKSILRIFGFNLKSKNLFLSGDLNHYGEIIRIMGAKNVFFCPNLSQFIIINFLKYFHLYRTTITLQTLIF